MTDGKSIAIDFSIKRTAKELDFRSPIEDNLEKPYFPGAFDVTNSSNRGFYFLNVPEEKPFSNRLAGTILISDTSKLDITKINVNFLMNDYQYYLVSNWNILLVLKSIDHLKNEMRSVE